MAGNKNWTWGRPVFGAQLKLLGRKQKLDLGRPDLGRLDLGRLEVEGIDLGAI